MSEDQAANETWCVDLSRDGATSMRAAPIVVRRALATLLDEMSESGVPSDARHLDDGSFLIRVGETEAIVLVDTEKRSILIARLSARTPTTTRNALRAAHVPPRTSRLLARQLDELAADVRTAFRSFRRGPGFVFAVVATLSIAIGGATTFFGLGDTVFRSALPFEDDEQLLRFRDRRVSPGGEPRRFNMSPLDFSSIRDENTTLTGVVAAGGVNHVLTGDGAAQRVNVIHVSRGWADVLGVRVGAGRLFTQSEEELGPAAQVALITHSLWETRFGGDPALIGRQVAYDAGVLTIVGVLQPRFRFPYDADLWVPWRWDETNGTAHDLNVVGRMADGVTIEQVRKDLDRIALSLQETRADTNTNLFLNAESLRGVLIDGEGQVLVALMAAVGFLLVLACVNVTNLFVARFVNRRREVGIRVALGAGRLREIRGFMVETVLLFSLGGLAGLGLSLWLGDLLSMLVPDTMRSQLDMAGLQITPSLVAFAGGLSLLAGLIFGGMAALRGTRTDIAQILKDGGRAGSPGGTRVQRGLVVTQLALSLALLVGAGVLFEHFERLSSAGLGFEVEGLYTLRVAVGEERFAEEDARLDIVGRLEDAIRGVPAVEAAAYTTVNPICCGDWGAPIEVEGQPNPEGSTHLIHHRLIGAGYFAAMGTPIVRGRDFDARDRLGGPTTVIVDDALAKRFWPTDDPLGKRIRLEREGEPWRTVVGVVGDVEKSGDYTETWYLPYTEDPTSRSSERLHFMVRSQKSSVLDLARRAVQDVDPNLAVYEARTMASLRGENISQDRMGAAVGSVFAAFGLLLAGLGVFGMLSYNVSTLSREIGTRIALGAHPTQVTTIVLKSALRLTGVGALLGLVAAVALNQALARMIFGVEFAGVGLLAGLAMLLVVASGIAAAIPALRAARVDPIEVLRD